jgi:hypothetical protein
MPMAWLVASLALGAGCTTPMPIHAVDGGAPGLDAPVMGVDAGEDAASTDVPAVPSDTPLAADVFVPPPDAGSDAPSIDAPPDAGRSCTTTYGGVPEFMLCAETATTCEFFARTLGGCSGVCMTRGGTCMASYDEGPDGSECTRQGSRSCTFSSLDALCVCSR